MVSLSTRMLRPSVHTARQSDVSLSTVILLADSASYVRNVLHFTGEAHHTWTSPSPAPHASDIPQIKICGPSMVHVNCQIDWYSLGLSDLRILLDQICN